MNVHVRIGIMALALVVAAGVGRVSAQGLTGQISGSVVDGSSSVLPGVTISVQNANTQVKRAVDTDQNGLFVITDLLAGKYDVTVTLAGFKTYQQNGVTLSANERLALRPIVLEVGQLEETVAVTAEAARVQTQSGERSGVITQEQLQDISLKGKDYLGMLRTMPGVVDTQNREAPGWNNLGGLSINGGRNSTINLTYDGVTNLDTGSNTGPFLAPGLDSIAEIKVLTSNYQAEYGRSSGGTINVITKSGTQQFHGGGFYSKRDDKFNANEWQNNRVGAAKPPYKFDYSGWHVGGPVTIPGKFNTSRDKLFFFWNQEFLPRTNPGSLTKRTMPTELERRGDFSQSFQSGANGALIVIRDPQTGQPFPGNIIPANRIDRNGQALLNLLPLPNFNDPDKQSNYSFQSSFDQPRNDQVARVDWNVGPKTLFYSRLNYGYEAFKGGWGFVLNNANWPQLPIAYEIHSYGVVNTLLHTFSPTTVMEVTVGLNHGKQTVEPLTQADLERNDRTLVGLGGLPQFYPDANPDRIVPNVNFGVAGLNLANMPTLGVEGRYPFFGENDIWNSSVNLTKVMGSHNMKVGLFYEYTTRPAARSTQFNGSFNFDRNTANPLDANHPYANALIGSVNSYSEATGHPDANARFRNVEWFIQDSWRVKPNFTIDAGIRFYRIGPTISAGDRLAVFNPEAYNINQAPQFIQPVNTPQGRRGINPLTGEILPAVKIGTFAPNSGTPFNGTEIVDEGLLDTPPIQVAPRIGFSWDVTGDGRTAVRGGFGIFPDRFNDDIVLQHVELPPIVQTPTANYTTINELLSTPLSLSPATARVVNRDYKPQQIKNWSIGVQRDIGYKLLADVAYVGSVGRRMLQTRNINAVPYGANFLAANIDPTTGSALPNNFLRPYRGYGDILVSEFAGFSDYHALQMAVNRRYTRGFRMGVAYTLSSAKNVGASSTQNNPTVNPFLDIRDRNYGSVGRKHNLSINYSYDVPGLSQHWDNKVVRAIFDDWQISGLTSALSGATLPLSYTIQGVSDLTGGAGSGLDTRVDFTCDPNLSRGDRSWDRAFATECVAPPSLSTNRVGTGKLDDLIGPGYLNWDITFSKNIPLGGNRRAQFRTELYNAFNNTQFAGVNTGAVFNAAGVQTNTEFGRYTSARDARRIQFTLRVDF